MPGEYQRQPVEIGVTLVAVIAGALSGATMGEPVAQRLHFLGLSPHNASTLGYVLVIGLTTYFTLVVGELVPKQVALRAAVPIALVMARPMALFARIAAPFAVAARHLLVADPQRAAPASSRRPPADRPGAADDLCRGHPQRGDRGR